MKQVTLCLHCLKPYTGSRWQHDWDCPKVEKIPCDTYGCKRPKPDTHVFCDHCEAEYREDPDAFK